MAETLNTGVPSDTTPAPEGHDAAMAAKFDASQETPKTESFTPEQPSKPDWLPEKFFKDGKPDYEALAKSYGELEKGKGKSETEATKAPADVPPEAAKDATVEQAQTALESVGLDYNAISARYQQAGELAADDRAALNKAGVPDAMIDAYVAGQAAIADQYVSSIKDAVGGAEEYSKITAWAAKGLPANEVAAFNKVMDGRDADAAKLAVAGLKAKFEAAMGQEPTLVRGSNTTAVGDVFRSTEQLTAAIQDPRYRADPAYRADVKAKLARSPIL